MLNDETLADLGDTIKDALAALREVARSKSESGEVRVQASRAILDFATEVLSLANYDEDEDEEYED